MFLLLVVLYKAMGGELLDAEVPNTRLASVHAINRTNNFYIFSAEELHAGFLFVISWFSLAG